MTSHLSDRFFADLAALGARRASDPSIFLTVWCVESGLNPGAINSIGARGLNQMLPSTLVALGAPADFEQLSGEAQLPWIEKMIASGEHRNRGPFESAGRYYHSNFFPLTMSRGNTPDTIVVARDASDPRERAAYVANPALDADGDGKITLADLATILDRTRTNKCQDAFARLNAAVDNLLPNATPIAWKNSSREPSTADAAIGAGLLTGALALSLLRRRRAT